MYCTAENIHVENQIFDHLAIPLLNCQQIEVKSNKDKSHLFLFLCDPVYYILQQSS